MPSSSILVNYRTRKLDPSTFLEPILLESRSSPPGGEMDVEVIDGTLEIKMSSDDLSTLRAMLNSYLGLLSVAERAHDV